MEESISTSAGTLSSPTFIISPIYNFWACTLLSSHLPLIIYIFLYNFSLSFLSRDMIRKCWKSSSTALKAKIQAKGNI